jgi:DNA polymerase elongation subunit (family B)
MPIEFDKSFLSDSQLAGGESDSSVESLLYGENTEENIMAVHQQGESKMRIYSRSPNGITSRDEEFFPFFHLSDASYLSNFPRKHWVKELSGNNYFRYLCAFSSSTSMWDGVRHTLDSYNSQQNTRIENFSELPVLHLRTDLVAQFLIQTGRTLFKGMEFNDLHRMQLDIETYYKPSAPRGRSSRMNDQIIIVALSDNRGWQQVLETRHKTEEQLLRELVNVIVTKDPDVIEGHNIYGFDLPYIMRRCELNHVEFAIGRDGTIPHRYDSRMSFAERSVEYSSFEVNGRHIIDTLLLLQTYDVSKRTLESYGLKYAAKHFGFAKPNRVYVEGKDIATTWDETPEKLIQYAADDVEETRMLSDYLSPSYFYMAKMIPASYGALARTGSATKIESMLLREYVKRRHSIPKPETGSQIAGGYTDVFYTGVLGPVVHLDVESLYPSIMLNESIAPASDELKVFQTILRYLKALRIDAKNRMKSAKEQSTKAKYDAMQSAFKILINSFYGYLGYSRALFNDYSAADMIASRGQEILRDIIQASRANGGTVVEVDTDGIFLVPPSAAQDERSIDKFIKSISSTLPEGVNLGVEGRFKKIFSYKMKNYALLGNDGSIKLRGSSLISRSMERFGRSFIRECIEALLSDDIRQLHDIYLDYSSRIGEHRMPVTEFVKVETLKSSLESYQDKIKNDERNRSAAYEAAIAGSMSWKAGDRISFYITGNDPHARGFENCKLSDDWDSDSPDENIPYYLRRLDEFASKFAAFFKLADFKAIFSREDLFGFNSEGISILTLPVTEGLDKESEGKEEDEIGETAP